MADAPQDDLTAADAMSGWSVGVTADRRAEEQIELLHRYGARTIHAPMLDSQPLGPGDPLASAIDAMVDQGPEIVVLSTRTGLGSLLDAAEELGAAEPLRSTVTAATLVACGPTAAEAAMGEGWTVSWHAPDASSETVVEHLAHIGVEGRRVAIVLDRLEAAVLASPVAALGAEVVEVPVDRRELPDVHGPAGRLIAAVAECTVDAVTFTSSTSVRNFVVVARATGRLDEVREALTGPTLAVSVGPVCTASIVDAGFRPPIEASSARLDAMVDTLADRAAERRTPVRVGEVELLLDATHPVIAGTVVDMGPRERSVLDVLAVRPGAVVSKVALCQQVWGRSTGLHTVEVTVGRLRDRLASACGQLVSIDTVPRRGYRLVGGQR